MAEPEAIKPKRKRYGPDTGRPVGRPFGHTYEVSDGLRHRSMSRRHEALLNRELVAIRALEARERRTDPCWLMPEELYKRLEAIQDWLVRIPRAREKNQELLTAAQSEVPVAQLEAVARRELLAAAAEWTEEQWAMVDGVRAQKQPGRWVLAEAAP